MHMSFRLYNLIYYHMAPVVTTAFPHINCWKPLFLLKISANFVNLTISCPSYSFPCLPHFTRLNNATECVPQFLNSPGICPMPSDKGFIKKQHLQMFKCKRLSSLERSFRLARFSDLLRPQHRLYHSLRYREWRVPLSYALRPESTLQKRSETFFF